MPRTHRHLRAEADGYAAAIGLTPEDKIFCTISLFHTYGMGCCLLAAVRSGATLVLFDDPNPFVLQRGRALALIERERATVFPGVPFTFRMLAEAPESADLSSLRRASRRRRRCRDRRSGRSTSASGCRCASCTAAPRRAA